MIIFEFILTQLHMFRQLRSTWLFFGTMFVISCNNDASSPRNTADSPDNFAANSIISVDTTVSNDSVQLHRRTRVKQALAQNLPIIFLENLDNDRALAQIIASSDERFRELLTEKPSGKPYLNEIFNIYKARPQDMPQGSDTSGLYRVEMYNYALNMTIVAMVSLPAKQAISVNTYPQSQPDLNKELEDLAVSIAIHSPDVIKALGYKPGEQDAVMAATKTALNRTKCERSMHLCVAPTFIKGDKALWAIVDLTDNRLVGIRWTNVGTTGPGERISERKLVFDKIMECDCRQQKNLTRDDWKLNYVLTTSDGLRVSDVYYHDQLVIHNAKLVDWHVNYSGTDGFGYSDAIGCPEFSPAAVLAVTEPRISDLMENGKKIGFVLEQTFQSEQWPQACNYNYLQRYEFYNDGRFRPIVASLGRGCGSDGTYRPVTRILLAGDANEFSEWSADGKWQPWTIEQWRLQNPQTRYTTEGYQYRVSGKDGRGYFIVPGNGQFGDGGRGDNAYVYITKFHPEKDEGESDLVTVGPCCNTDYRQGPEKFLEPQAEDIRQGKLVMWYVPQLKNDNEKGREYCWAESVLENGVYKTKAYPCMSGPLFVPFH